MGNKLYIVDYDIPVSPARSRVQFYRDLEKLGIQKQYSTLSVIHTEEEYLAKAVYLLVVAHGGNEHVYRATEIDPVL